MGFVSRKIAPAEFGLHLRQMASMLSTGIPLSRVLRTMSNISSNKFYKEMYSSLARKVEAGISLSQAVLSYRDVFPVEFPHIIKVGEESGSLDSILRDYSLQQEELGALKRSVKSALLYPKVVIGFAFVVFAVVVIYTIPKFLDIYHQIKVAPPLLVSVLGNIGKVLSLHPVSVGMVISAMLVAIFFLQKTKLKEYSDTIFNIIIPPLRKLKHEFSWSTYLGTLSMLLHAGVVLTESLQIVSNLRPGEIIEDDYNRMIRGVHGGSSFSHEIKRAGFPELVHAVVEVKEQTGELDKGLQEVAEHYRGELQVTLKKFQSLIEPVVVAVLGGFVGIVVFSLFMPIIKVYMTLISH